MGYKFTNGCLGFPEIGVIVRSRIVSPGIGLKKRRGVRRHLYVVERQVVLWIVSLMRAVLIESAAPPGDHICLQMRVAHIRVVPVAFALIPDESFDRQLSQGMDHAVVKCRSV